MSRVATEKELKEAVKRKEESIVVIGDLARLIKEDSRNTVKKGAKKLGNIVSKGLLGMGTIILITSPVVIPVASLTVGVLGTIFTKESLKKYDVLIPNEGDYIELKRKK